MNSNAKNACQNCPLDQSTSNDSQTTKTNLILREIPSETNGHFMHKVIYSKKSETALNESFE